MTNWACEGGPPNVLMRNGWTRNTLKEGDQVTIEGALAKDGSKRCNSRSVNLADGKRVFESGVMRTGTPPRKVDVDLKGTKTLVLQVTDAADGTQYDHGDWADAKLVFSGAKPQAIAITFVRSAGTLVTP